MRPPVLFVLLEHRFHLGRASGDGDLVFSTLTSDLIEARVTSPPPLKLVPFASFVPASKTPTTRVRRAEHEANRGQRTPLAPHGGGGSLRRCYLELDAGRHHYLMERRGPASAA